MRTKALLLTAALSAAGVATSMAQAVYSVNVVGYVNTVLKPGFNLVSNPLTATDNTIAGLFKGVPVNTSVYKYDPASGYKISTFDPDDLVFEPNGSVTVNPGEGVFVKNPTSANVTVTFVGEVPLSTTVNLPKGLSIASSAVPKSGTAADLGLVGSPNDVLYQYVNTGVAATSGYKISTFDPDDLQWEPALGTLGVGEAVFIKKAAAGTWTTSFNVSGQ